MADPAFIAASSGTAPSGGSLTITKPAGTLNGHAMIAFIAYPTSVTAVPAGWDVQDREQITGLNISTYQRAAGTSEPSSWSWTVTSGGPAVGGIVTMSGVDLAIQGLLDATSATGTGTVQDGANFTPDRNELVLFCLSAEILGSSASDAYTFTGPAVERFDNWASNGSAGIAFAMAQLILPTVANTSTLGITTTSGLSKTWLGTKISYTAASGWYLGLLSSAAAGSGSLTISITGGAAFIAPNVASASGSGALSIRTVSPVSGSVAATGSAALALTATPRLALSAVGTASTALRVTALTQLPSLSATAAAASFFLPRVLKPGPPAFIAATSGSSLSSTLVLNKPPGTALGDVMIAVVISSTDPTGPVDWDTETGTSFTGLFLRVFTRVSVSAEVNSYTFLSGGGIPVVGGIASFSGLVSGSRDARATTGGTSNSQNSGIDVTTTRDAELIIAISGEELLTTGGDSYTHAGTVEVFDTSVSSGTAGFALTLGYVTQVRNGSTAPLGIGITSGLSKRYLGYRLSYTPLVPYIAPTATAVSSDSLAGVLFGPSSVALTLSGSASSTSSFALRATGSFSLVAAAHGSGSLLLSVALNRPILLL